ncbi:TPA: DUF3828 domain-containing protein [Enterobacter cancerogenus]|nr:DUF3828 domain-containing protein [Enterobacter cancerogenus]HDR2167790.1 DUF3828 domain-containing protein [Enterobacter cancerogenus]HDR2270431.1 DUF3828 domain-containing protein [Enterobacter cancerogenus]
MNFITVLIATFALVTASFAHAVGVSCLSPEKTTSDFYHWYLQELRQRNYPLISSAVDDKQNLKKWISPELLQQLEASVNDNDLDAEYFTDAQDIFDDWVKNISVQKSKRAEHHADVRLTLGVTEIKKDYDISLNDSDGCWKIEHVNASH